MNRWTTRALLLLPLLLFGGLVRNIYPNRKLGVGLSLNAMTVGVMSVLGPTAGAFANSRQARSTQATRSRSRSTLPWTQRSAACRRRSRSPRKT